MGNIVPLLKPGKTNTALPSNYRGITLTCILSKVVERIVCDQITTYLRERNVLSESQYGFRTGRSYADLLTVAIDDWLLAQDSEMHTFIVFIDLSKAFDNVQHQLLLLKLQQDGIRAQHLLGSGVTCLNAHKMLCSMAHHQSTSTHQKVFPRALWQRPWTVTLQHLWSRTSFNC